MGDILLEDIENFYPPKDTSNSNPIQNGAGSYNINEATATNNGFEQRQSETSFQSLDLVQKTVNHFKDIFSNNSVAMEVNCLEPIGLTPFHSALAQGDKTFILDVLTALDSSLQEIVVNCPVDYSKPNALQMDVLEIKAQNFPEKHRKAILGHYKSASVPAECNHSKRELEFQLPIAIAATSGEYDVIQILLDQKADLFKTDSQSNNIIHSLVTLSINHSDIAMKILNKIMEETQSVDDKKRLVMAKNLKGYYPLDMAMNEVSFEFAKYLLNIDGVYRFPVKDCGIFQHVLYDVSDYEVMGSNIMHIFHYLATITEEDLSKLDKCQFMDSEPIKTWTMAKVKSHRAQTVVWAAAWVIILTLYFVSVGMYFIQSGKKPPQPLSIALLINASILLLGEISNGISERKVYKLIYENSHKGFPIAFSPAYRVFHLLFALSLTITESLHLADVACDKNKELFVTLYVLNAVFGLSSLLLFTQLNQHTGHLLIIIDRMMWDVILFISVAGIIFFSFALSFYLLHAPPMCADPNKTLDWNKTQDMFATFASTLYETQLLALGIMAPKNLYFEEAQIPTLAMILYVVFLIMLCIVLLNLLIAIMSDRVSELSNHKQTIMYIQALSLAMFLEGKMRVTLQFSCSKYNPFVLIHRKTLAKYFVMNNDETRVFLHVLEKIPQMLNLDSQQLSSISTITNVKLFFQAKRKNNVQPGNA